MKRKRHVALAVAAAVLILSASAALVFADPSMESRSGLGAALYASIALYVAYLVATWPASDDRRSRGDSRR